MTNHKQACPFCAIGKLEAPGKILAADPYAYALTPLNPVTPGHTLIIPFEHVTDFTDSPAVAADTMHFAAWYARRHLPGPVNLITSKGTEGTQSVFHLHLHLVPRHKNDELALPWTPAKGPQQ